MPLGDAILNLRTGLNPRKNFSLNTNDACCWYVTVRELAGLDVVFSDKTDRISEEAIEKINCRSKLQMDDVLISATGTIGNTALVRETPENWNIKEGVYAITPDQTIIRSLYLLNWFHSSDAMRQLKSASEGGTVKSVSMNKMKRIVIPVPDLEEQDEIVDLLEVFNTLSEDISQGLPAEIEARRKQYKYYRDKLLTFKEKAA